MNLIRFIANNRFSDDSVRAIFSVPEDLSAVKIVTDDILGRLLSVETSLYGNSNFRDSKHGPTFFSFDYSDIMRQASFIIPTLVEVDRFNKRIHYDKVDLDELFPSLGGNYAGLFSRGENYNPIYSPASELSEKQINFANEITSGRTFTSGFLFNDKGTAYATRVLSDDFNFNELTIHFSMMSLLDHLGFTVGNPLTSKSVDEIDLMFGDRDRILFLPHNSSGFDNYNVFWEHAWFDNGERTNVYNRARDIIGLHDQSELEVLFRLIDWSILYRTHEIRICSF